jgi:Rrf2 family transcriptional regulator, iron-sulfur cluster assembly transcription factor
MQLSTRGRYAVMAMAELACREAGDCACGHVTVAELAAAQHLSSCYLEQLFGRMRRAGLVRSARGPGGGYRLARPASQITVADVIAASEEEMRTTRCQPGGPTCQAAPPGERCLTHGLWEALSIQIATFLHSVTLADVIGGTVATGPMAAGTIKTQAVQAA